MPSVNPKHLCGDCGKPYNPYNGAPVIFSCNANGGLAQDIAANLSKRLCIEIGEAKSKIFQDGETHIKPAKTVRGKDCYIVQTMTAYEHNGREYSVNDALMELLIMVDTTLRAGARRVTAVIPHMAYMRQDRQTSAREPLTAKIVTNMLQSAGVDRVLTMDLHTPQVQSFFDKDTLLTNLFGSTIFINHYREKFPVLKGEDVAAKQDIIIVSPDIGAARMARYFALKLGIEYAIINKVRGKDGEVELTHLIGEARGKTVIIPDDMAGTGGTLVKNVEMLINEHGAKEVYACCTHALLAGNAVERLVNSPIKELAVLDTVNIPEKKRFDRLKLLSASELFSEAIHNMHLDLPMSFMYDDQMG